MIDEKPPWSYPERAAELMERSSTLLDIGTGGGEKLLALHDHWPAMVVVTEDYPPNVELARDQLEPLGVEVKDAQATDDSPLPFADGTFDLILNRHSSINCKEVARILTPGGVFLTQQVHHLWAQDLIAVFDATPPFPDATPEYHVPRLIRAGLVIENAEEWLGNLLFTDVGAIVYYLRAVPWLVPGFSVDTHLDNLLRLQRRIEDRGKLVFEARLFWIEARKPRKEREVM
jgi:SAM-dependent methyltransferase